MTLRRMNRPVLACAFGLALLLAGADAALACACCTEPAQRRVELQKIDAAILAELEKLRFKSEAKLKLDGGYDDAIKGLDDPKEDFTLEVARHQDRIAFALRDAKGRTGTLSLLQPRSVSILEVDPRDSKDTGYGPPLYKEWKLTTAVAGDGLFRASVGPNRRITLVLHGRGNSCTTAADFKHWTLLVHGTGTETYTFYGELQAE